MQQLQFIQQRIFEIRGQKVMPARLRHSGGLDFDLAALYEVETRVFNQAVKRNIDSFPDEFMFRLTAEEWKEMSSQIVITYSQNIDNNDIASSQISSGLSKRPKSALPYAFTEHGVTMLASVLKSHKARKMNIAIVRAFIAMRKMSLQYADVIKVIEELKDRVSGHDAQLKPYPAFGHLLLMEKEYAKSVFKNAA